MGAPGFVVIVCNKDSQLSSFKLYAQEKKKYMGISKVCNMNAGRDRKSS
jgi:hypothetical protein